VNTVLEDVLPGIVREISAMSTRLREGVRMLIPPPRLPRTRLKGFLACFQGEVAEVLLIDPKHLVEGLDGFRRAVQRKKTVDARTAF
jgi:hypothetical protein